MRSRCPTTIIHISEYFNIQRKLTLKLCRKCKEYYSPYTICQKCKPNKIESRTRTFPAGSIEYIDSGITYQFEYPENITPQAVKQFSLIIRHLESIFPDGYKHKSITSFFEKNHKLIEKLSKSYKSRKEHYDLICKLKGLVKSVTKRKVSIRYFYTIGILKTDNMKRYMMSIPKQTFEIISNNVDCVTEYINRLIEKDIHERGWNAGKESIFPPKS